MSGGVPDVARAHFDELLPAQRGGRDGAKKRSSGGISGGGSGGSGGEYSASEAGASGWDVDVVFFTEADQV